MPKLILAYSGGLDTTTAITWLSEERGYEVVALNINAGMSRDQDTLEERGIAAGASKVLVLDAREDFLRYFAFPALAAKLGSKGVLVGAEAVLPCVEEISL